MKCPMCGYDDEIKNTSHLIGYDEIKEALKIEGTILYIELREEYDDMIIVTKKED